MLYSGSIAMPPVYPIGCYNVGMDDDETPFSKLCYSILVGFQFIVALNVFTDGKSNELIKEYGYKGYRRGLDFIHRERDFQRQYARVYFEALEIVGANEHD